MQTLQASRQLIKYFPVHESTADSDTQTTAEIDQLIQSTLASVLNAARDYGVITTLKNYKL